LALVVDELRVANWQRSKNARAHNRPKPISPLAKAKPIGHTDRSSAEVQAYLARLNPPHPAA
jgi:hypothetical protein